MAANCWVCNKDSHASCRFCGRFVCKDHASKMPTFLAIYVGANQTPKARLDDGKPEGITPLEISELPRLQRQIMFFMLRDQHAALEGITLTILKNNFQNETESRLSEVLAELHKNGWLIQMGESPNVHYKINLRRKRGTILNGVWSNVMDRLAEKPASKPWDFKF